MLSLMLATLGYMRCPFYGHSTLIDSCQIQNICDLGIHFEKSTLAEYFMQ